ncbi:DnaA ATPase domain-containing protein [Hasllibacter sp. MH4015]|uniref:DnaA ATPase domain-containing protein n=1 Tax=Hasllibacter sp. MH4015 TaxID=2854029 RepID=UPI001CD64247|nr:DnaA/Hda family protein [Hasllibacter sp. MH4015]
MAEQLTFDLPLRPAMGRDDFYVSAANAAAVALIDTWRDWPSGKLVLTGDEGAGKSHLAHVWAEQAGARIVAAREVAERLNDLTDAPALAVEDAEDVAGHSAAEEALFHLHNALINRNAPLLLTARRAPSRWGLRLPDLASRMAQAGLAHIDPPDDQLLMVVLMKHAADRQIPLTPTMLGYLGPRIPRSFTAAADVVARIDAAALSQKKPPNMAHVRAALAQMTPDPSS